MKSEEQWKGNAGLEAASNLHGLPVADDSPAYYGDYRRRHKDTAADITAL